MEKHIKILTTTTRKEGPANAQTMWNKVGKLICMLTTSSKGAC